MGVRGSNTHVASIKKVTALEPPFLARWMCASRSYCPASSRPSRFHRDRCRPSPPSDQRSSLDRSSCCSGVLTNYLDDIVAEDEILSILNVPPGKMGRVIGRKGAFFQSVKEACNAEIIIGGAKGPPDKVYFIGPVMQGKLKQ